MAAKPKYEYLAVTYDIPQNDTDSSLTDWLNNFGNDGWELVSTYKHWWQDADLKQDCWIFKRQK